MSSNVIDVLGAPDTFLKSIFKNLQAKGINVSNYQLDHICYRVETIKRYEVLKKVLKDHGKLLAETMISNRPIATFLLDEPFHFMGRMINCLELPSPKEGSPYKEGYEHVEFVLDRSFEQFIADHPSVDFNLKGIDKAVNADISIKFPEGGVKFHHHTLEYVIKYLD